MTLTVSNEQEELRRSVRRFLAEKASTAEVRRAVESEHGHDPAVWDLMSGQLGLPAIALPEVYGGLGYGAVELGIVLEELGRTVSPEPLLSSVALAGRALATSDDAELTRRWLPGIAEGTVTGALAVSEDGSSWSTKALHTVAEPHGEGFRLTGVKMFVVDGCSADVLLVAATDADGPALFVVEPDTTVSRTPLATLDPTRRLARVALAGTPARRLDSPPGHLREVLDLGLVAVAAEQVGGAQACLDLTVEYATVRVQFGRAIGSFQAVKHRCADMLVQLEAARSVLQHAVALAADPDGKDAGDLTAAAAACAAWCGRAYTDIAKATIQLHGGIGYTWEHDAHLYLRRAKSTELLFGAPVQHRARLAELVGAGRSRPPTRPAAPGTAPEVLPGAETDERFRARLREFLTEQHPGPAPRGVQERRAWQKAWRARLYDAGLSGPSWPREYGGMDLSFAQQVIYQEEYARARVPGPQGTGLGIAAPTIITYATEEQKQRWLRPMLRGDVVWAQGYSEPEAGSDLPALRTTARRDGDHYVVDGQKVWNTHADYADLLFTLVRTGTQESRQKGISYLIIDAHAPGVTVRPLRDLTGGTHFSEIFLSGVRVPVADRVGEQDDGWRLARTSLGHERAAGAMNQATLYRRVLDELVELARERGLTDDPLVRDRLADFEIRVRIMHRSGMRTISDILSTGEPGPASSTSRLFITIFEQDLHEFAVDMLGADGLLTRDDSRAVQRGRWLGGFLSTRASTIGAGTAEIQRNTIAEQVLGLPRDPIMPPR